MYRIYLIAARSKNNVIGNNNQLLWKLKEDMKFFKEKTLNNCVIMGRKTHESIGKKLDNRINIVLSRSINETHVDDKGVFFCKNSEDVANILQSLNFKGDVFIIGGGEIYSKVIDKVDAMYITEINKEYEGDTYFPTFKKSDFEKIVLDDVVEDDINYKFVKYLRKTT